MRSCLLCVCAHVYVHVYARVFMRACLCFRVCIPFPAGRGFCDASKTLLARVGDTGMLMWRVQTHYDNTAQTVDRALFVFNNSINGVWSVY